MNIVLFIQITILVYTFTFAAAFLKDCIHHREEFNGSKFIPLALIGFISDLLDTWGIGSFATCQASFKFTHSCSDENMPGTLNVGHAIPTITEFLLFLQLVKIEGLTLISLIAGAVAGAIYGASIVSKWSPRLIRIALGSALLILAAVLSMKLAHIGPFEKTIPPETIISELEHSGFTVTGGDISFDTVPSITMSELHTLIPKLKSEGIHTIIRSELSQVISEHLVYGLSGSKLVLGIVINTLLGALMTIGVGLYAPCMAMVSALGINVTAAFPIMMGSCAFLMPSAALKFIRSGRYDRKAAALITVFGTLGVFVAYKAAAALPIDTLTGIVICVMIYTAITFFRDARKTTL